MEVMSVECLNIGPRFQFLRSQPKMVKTARCRVERQAYIHIPFRLIEYYFG